MAAELEVPFNRLVVARYTFVNQAGDVADPTTVMARVERPSGAATTYTYLVDGALVREQLGTFAIQVRGDEPGRWRCRWKGRGAVDVDDVLTWWVRKAEVE